MKKHFYTLFLLLLSLTVYSQNNIQWKALDNNKGEYNYKSLIKTSPQEQKAVFGIAHNNLLLKTKYNLFIRKYNGDMTSFSDDAIPSECPKSLAIMGFHDYNVFYGNVGTIDKTIKLDDFLSEPNKVVIADNNMNTLVNLNFPLHSKRNRYTSIPNICISADSNYIIIVNVELLNVYKVDFKFQKSNYYVDVYDKYLNHVWCDSIITDNVFGEAYQIQDMKFNYYDNKLVVTAYHENDSKASNKATIFAVLYEKPQSYKMILNQELSQNIILFNTLFDKSGKIFFAGYAIHHPSVTVQFGNNSNMSPGNPENQLFYLCKDIKFPNEKPVFKCFNLDNEFLANFPEQKKFLKQNYANPTQLLYQNNKLYYIDDHVISTSFQNSSPLKTYNFDQLFLMVFDAEGNIEWMKSINKKVILKEFIDFKKPSGDAYKKDNGIGIFYYDNIKNVFDKKLKSQGTSYKGLCLVHATISPDGQIKKTIVSNIGETKIWAYLKDIRIITDNKYLIMGRGGDPFKITEVFGGFYSETK